MIEPYRMVVVNVIASLIVLGGVLFYRFIFPKKKVNLFTLLLIVSVLPIISIFRAGDYESGDFNIHIYRMMAFFDSLKEGILIPSWAGPLNATYGNPLFLFNYTLPYYLICGLHFLGISFITATKLYLGFTLYVSGIFMYLLAKEIFKHKLIAFSAAIFYLFAPYHLIDVHFRATLGESTIFCIAPLILLFLIIFNKKPKLVYLFLISLLTYLLLLAHPLLAGVFIGIFIAYIAFDYLLNKNLRMLAMKLTSLVFGMLIATHIWLPFIAYSSYMYHFPPVSNVGFYPFHLLFFSPWRFGFLFQGPKGELAQIIGYPQLFVLLTSIILVILRKFKKNEFKQIVFWLTMFIITLFLMSPLSNPFWMYSSTVGAMLTQYGRLSLALAFITSIIAGYFTLFFIKKEKLIYLLLIIVVGVTILNWGHRRTIPEITDVVLLKNVPYSTLSEGPSYYIDTKWADPKQFWFSQIPSQHLEIISGQGEIKELQRTTITHTYQVIALTTLNLKENTLYFPGWQATCNNNPISISPGERGVITFALTKGNCLLKVSYNDLPIFLATKIISIISIILIIVFVGLSLLRKLR
jgi:ABC-type multidrug transport system fused ATPase/permease subunit